MQDSILGGFTGQLQNRFILQEIFKSHRLHMDNAKLQAIARMQLQHGIRGPAIYGDADGRRRAAGRRRHDDGAQGPTAQARLRDGRVWRRVVVWPAGYADGGLSRLRGCV